MCFIELLTVPESESDLGRKDIRIVTSQGHFSLCSFGFLSLAEFQPIHTPFGIAIARPETMALANLLHHPAIGDQPISGIIGGRRIKRSNKDIGRVLALAYLAEARQEDSLLAWPQVWAAALQSRFNRVVSIEEIRAKEGNLSNPLFFGGETQAQVYAATETAITVLPDALAKWVQSSQQVRKSLVTLGI